MGVSDVDSGQTLTVSLVSISSALSGLSVNSNTVMVTPGIGSAGSYTITLSVTDGSASA